MIKADNDKDIYLVFEYMGKLIKNVQISNFHREALAVRILNSTVQLVKLTIHLVLETFSKHCLETEIAGKASRDSFCLVRCDSVCFPVIITNDLHVRVLSKRRFLPGFLAKF